MKYFLLLILILPAFSFWAQNPRWKTLTQKSVALRYKIPKGWYVGGYQSPKRCKCTGASLNTAFDGSINMLIFASATYGTDSLARQTIWGNEFDSELVQFSDSLHSNENHFLKEFSTWKNDKKEFVLKYSSDSTKNAYIFYFWGSKEALLKKEQLIDQIMQSVKPITNG